METGNVSLTDFLNLQKTLVVDLCSKANSQSVAPKDGYQCPTCSSGVLIKHEGKNGPFWGCSRYREGCKQTFQDINGKPQTTVYPCPKCDGNLNIRKGKKGYFWGCNRYPDCTELYDDNNGEPKLSQSTKPKKKSKFKVKR
ncbi:DNA topoisomerase 1 [bioreactor metagenome]|uniref:DNA topoisomerase 1 n=1 Tax=bioreactor metagenome TaxID=1076179 RepID=A0A645FDH9_9ZZZZ